MADTPKGELVVDAFREGNLISVGDNPTGPEEAEAAKLLERFIISLLGTEVGEHLQTLHLPPIPQHSYLHHDEDANKPKANRRVLLSNAETETIALPIKPMDGARFAISNVAATGMVTLNGMGAFIDSGDRDQYTIVSLTTTPGTQYEWMYRADLSMWVITQSTEPDLVTNLSSPFPPEIDGLLVAGTSLRLQAYYGNEPVSGTVAEYQRMIKVVRARYRQSEGKINAEYSRVAPSIDNMHGFMR